MSTTIDERVVEMRFDHSDFKKNAGETVSLLEKLKNALNFSGSSGLDELNKSARNVDLNPLTRSVEAVHQSFTAFEVAAVAALVNITNRAVDAGLSLAKSLSIDQITEGWDKYAQKTSSVQTIMAATEKEFSNTGEQMEYVNRQLDKLNWFTDETSYNFVDMVSNIGKFTANNIALDKSVTAMQGIATWAALSGANAGEASRAMYNLAQAVATGSVKLIDWRSIENANMATAQFKEIVLETASSMGLLRKQANGVYTTIGKGTKVTIADFNSALSEGWFTSEVLLNTLDKYGSFTNVLNKVSEATELTATELLHYMDSYRSGGEVAEKALSDMAAVIEDRGIQVSTKELAQLMDELTDSTYELGEKAFRAAQEAKTFEEAINATKDAVSTGWMNTWEIIFGDYEQAKEIWTGLAEELYDVFAGGAAERNRLLREALSLPDQYLDRSSASWNNLVKQIEKAGISGEEFANQCYEIGKQLNLLDEWSLTSFDDFRKSLENGWLTSETLITTLNSLMGPFANASAVVKDASHTFEDFKDVLGKLNRGELGEGDQLLRNLAESGWNVVAVQEAANKLLDQGEVSIEDYNAALEEMSILQYEKLGYDKSTIENLKRLRDAYSDTTYTIIDDGDAISKWWTGTELLFTGIAQAWNAIKGIFAAIGKGWEIAFPPMTSDRLYGILETFKNLTSTFNQWVHGYTMEDGSEILGITDDISDSVAGLASIFGLLLDVIKDIGSYAFEAFGGSLANGIKSVLSFTGRIGRLLVSFREWVKENKFIQTGIETLVSWITKASTVIREWISSFINLPQVQSIIADIQNRIQSFVTLIQNRFPRVSSLVGGLWDRFKELASNKDFNGIVQLIKDLAKALKEDLVDAFSSVEGKFPTITELFNKIVSSIKNLNTSSFPKWAQRLYNVASAFLTPVIGIFLSLIEMLATIAKNANSVFDFLTSIIGQFATAITENFGAIVAAFVAYKVARTIFNFAKSLWSLLNLLSSPIKAIVSAFNGFTSAVKTVGKSLSHSFNAFAVIEAAIAVGILGFTLIKLGKMNQTDLNKGLKAIAILSLIIGALMGLVWLMNKKGGITDSTKNVKVITGVAFKVLAIAASIYLIASAFIKLSDILKGKDFDDLKAPLLSISGIAVALVVLAGLFNRFGSSAGIGGALSILALAESVRMIVSALNDILKFVNGVAANDLGGNGSKRIVQVIEVLIGIAVSIGLLMVALGLFNKFSGGKSTKIAGGLLAAIIAIKMLVSVLKDINKFASDLGDPFPFIGVLVAFAGGLALLMLGLSKMNASSLNSGVGLLAAALGIRILVDVIKRLQSLSASDIFKGVIAIGALMIFMGIMTKLANGAKAFNSLKAGVSFLAIGASLLILTGAVALMSLIDPGRLTIATISMGILMITLGLLLACASLAKSLEPKYFISLAIILVALSGSVIMMGLMDPGSVLLGVAAMEALMIGLGLLLLMSRSIKSVDPKALVSFAVIMVALVGGAALLGLLDPGAVLIGVAAMDALMIAASIMMLLSVAMENVKIGPLLSIAGIIIVLAGAIWALASLDNPAGIIVATSALKAAMNAFSMMLLVVSIATRIAGGFSTSAILSLAVIGTIVVALAWVIGELVEKIGPDGATSAFVIATSLTELMLGMAVLMKAVGALGKIDPGTVAMGMVNLGIIIGLLAVILVVLGVINKIAPFISTALEWSFPLLRDLGRAFGEVIGGFIDGLFGINTKSLSDRLTEFGDAVSNFVESIKGIDDSAVRAIKSLIELLLAMAGADLINAVTSWFGGDTTSLVSFGEELEAFGPMLVSFSDSVSGGNIDAQAIESAAEAAGSLNKLAKNLPRSGGFVGTIVGDRQTLEQFGSGIVSFGSSLVAFSAALSEGNGFDSNLVKESADAASSLTALASNLPRTGGWAATLIGDKQTLDEFGTGIVTFASSLVAFSAALSEGDGVNLALIEESTKAAEKLSDLQNKLPSLNGWSQKITGNPQTLQEFGTGLMTFGTALSGYSTELGKVRNWGLFDTAVTATESIVELSTKLGTDDGWINKIFGGGQTDIGEFGSKLEKFAQGLVNYSVKAAEINTTGLENAEKLTTYLIGLANSTDISNIEKLDGVGKYISGLGSDLSRYYNYVSLFDADKFSKTTTNLSELVTVIRSIGAISSGITSGFSEALVSLATVSLDDFCSVFENSSERVTSAIAALALNATVAAMNSSIEFETAGIYSVTAYLNGLISDKADFNGTAKTMTTKVVDALKSSANLFEEAGKLLNTNFINGLNSNPVNLLYAGISMANYVVVGITSSGAIRDAYTLGGNFGIGFYNGIVGYTGSVANAAYSLGRAAVENLQAAIDAHSPSRETNALGEFAGAGFVNGMLSYLQKAGDAGEGLGQEAVDNLKSAIQNVPNLLANDINLNPVIRPIIDLSGAQDSAATLNGMFNRSIGMSAALAGITGGAFERARVGTAVSTANNDVNSASNGTQEQSVQYNTFNITSNDPEAVANAVSYRLQKQVERKESTWAQSSGTGYPRVRSRS